MSLNFDYATTSPNILQNAQNLISSATSQFIVRPLGSPNLTGISGFLFDILDDEEIVLESDITDHYVEANYAVQDHISLRPIRFTLRGFVGEVEDKFSSTLAAIFTQIESLETLGGLLPQFNTQDAQFYAKINDTAQKVSNVISQAQSVYQLFNNASTTQNKQQNAYQYFYKMWKTRQLCSVETPFDVFESMAIESVRALQTGETKFISDFTITFKQIQTVNSVKVINTVGSLITQNLGSVSNNSLVAGGRLQTAVSAPVNLGNTSGISTNSSNQSIDVSSTLKPLYLQQCTLPNEY